MGREGGGAEEEEKKEEEEGTEVVDRSCICWSRWTTQDEERRAWDFDDLCQDYDALEEEGTEGEVQKRGEENRSPSLAELCKMQQNTVPPIVDYHVM